MFRSLMTRTVAVALGLACVFGSADTASAAYKVRVTAPGPTGFTVTDNLAGIGSQDSTATIGTTDVMDVTNNSNAAIVLPFGAGSLTFNSITTNAATPNPNFLTWQYQVTYTSTVPNTASGAITIEYTRTGYGAPLGPTVLSASDSVTFSALNGGSFGSQQVTQIYTPGNNEFNNPPAGNVSLVGVTTLSNITGNNSGGDPFLSSPIANAVPYTLTTIVTLNFTKSGQFLGNGTISLAPAVGAPVPAGLVMALTGLPALGFFSRLRRRNTVQA